MRQLLIQRGGIVVLPALVAYVALATPHVVSGDGAEFSTLGAIGGVAHPSGYPLYLIYLRAMQWLPGSPAHAAAIATALLAAATLVVLHAACRAWGARPTAATLAIAVFACAAPALRLATEAEVFTLNDLCAAAILWLAAPTPPLTGRWQLAALGLAAGLGLANHSTCVLLAPIGIYAAVRRWRLIPYALAGFVVGLAPYLYLLATRETATAWTHLDSLGDLAHHVLRLDYGAFGTFASESRQTSGAFAGLIAEAGAAWLYVLPIAGLAALAEKLWRGPRLAWAMFALSLALAGPLLALRMNIAPVGYGAYVCERFYLLPIMLLAIPIAAALDRVRLPELAAAGLAVAILAAGIALRLPRLSRVHSPAIEHQLVDALNGLPPRAVIIESSDELHYGLGYAQQLRGVRPDVAYITWPQVFRAEYRARVAAATGLPMVAPAGGSLATTVVDAALAQGRPVFIDELERSIALAYPIYPYGMFYRVLPRGAALPSAGELLELNKQLFATYDLAYPAPEAADEPAASVHFTYARAWHAIAEAQRASRLDPRAADAVSAELMPK